MTHASHELAFGERRFFGLALLPDTAVDKLKSLNIPLDAKLGDVRAEESS